MALKTFKVQARWKDQIKSDRALQMRKYLLLIASLLTTIETFIQRRIDCTRHQMMALTIQCREDRRYIG